MFNIIIAYTIAVLHLMLIALNTISIPFIVAYTPFYIAAPLITFLVSPLIGGTYCMINNLENHYRIKAGLPEIVDRLWTTIEYFQNLVLKKPKS